ncbi:Bro-N domain-containing protein [Pseudovibrio brasiliensis]|uniref:Bro-N domain-containing protein n=1 Tax=Pseudovibrio brasiliensis TaxID=1898042 RepID=A0ABX8AUK0_9HYPH|nr:Bro-N domain-containing protein [Pseudovibrio brasiliensis]QUS57381.1 Bro-N domain-containing protein [Pseudovibrio brasiliensis]
MSALTIFDFEDHSLRTLSVEGLFWFIAKDVCTVLDIKNSRDAVAKLDSDDVRVVSTDTNAGKRQTTAVNESGLYSLIFNSRKPAAKKFKKWVTAEVLPALRQSGTYSMGPTPQKQEDAKQVLLVNEMNARANLLKEARYIYGREAAMALWDRLGLPEIAGEGVNEVAGTAADDPEGCLTHLINFTCGKNLSVRIALAFALADDIGARRMEQLGIKLRPQAYPDGVAIAYDHDYLWEVFRLTQWHGNWKLALQKLVGAHQSQNAITIDGKQRRAVILPLSLVESYVG